MIGCSTHRSSHNPYLPPRAYHSPAATVGAAVGLVGLAAGSEMLNSDRSKRTQRYGAVSVAAGTALLGVALLDAIAVERERDRLRLMYAAMRRYQRGTPVPADLFRPPPPPPPPLPYEFVDEAPLLPNP